LSSYLPAAAVKVRVCWQLSEQSSTAEVKLTGYELLVDGRHWSRVPLICTSTIVKVRSLSCQSVNILDVL